MPATEPANDDGTHVCGPCREYWDGLWQCRCGTFWHRLSGELMTFMFTDPQLRGRLRDYKMGIRFGEYESLGQAVARAAEERRARREREHERARLKWHEKQAAKRSARWRHIRRVILRDPCAYCGGVANQVDHVIPSTRGGTDARRNLVAACGPCNGEKGKRTPEEWEAWRIARGLAWPPVR